MYRLETMRSLEMNLKRLRCLLVIIVFSMPALAAVPGQIESFDDFNNVVDPNWIEVVAENYGSYVEQVLVGGANQVTEGLGSMKFDFTQYAWPVRFLYMTEALGLVVSAYCLLKTLDGIR